jgi:hypothetical protein
MIARFFQRLEEEKISYLLISGQAAVLYGAAFFSEDIDLWVEPKQANADALLRALSDLSATYYKLTPPVTEDYLCRGHGFHFCLPGETETFLDVMGQPPRVPVFAEAFEESVIMPTDWGNIPTIGIKHLTALKSTQRLGDYPVVSQLVLRYMEQVTAPDEADYRWALDNLHTADDLVLVLRRYPEAVSFCASLIPMAENAVRQISTGNDPDESALLSIERFLTDRILTRRQADRAYWRGIVAELRALREAGGLMPLGERVKINGAE